ncbi:hypothetical protein [Mesorhizobium sp.]|jgi:hypothetical protein|uniref:hypothetical protein n=1 Tax=Mesorhizobium sp. TaxID=1871066 RepID=UPI0035636DBD
MSGKLGTVAVFDNRPEAEVCLSMLDAYGIYASSAHLDTTRQGLIHVQVADSDLEAAKALIAATSQESD